MILLGAASLQAVGDILAPVVLVTSAAILAGGMLTMYGSVNDRMRTMTAQRLTVLTDADGTFRSRALLPPASVERLAEIDRELPLLLHRHGMIRDALVLTYLAVAVLVASMFLVAIGVTAGQAWVSTAALWIMLTATLLLSVALVQIVRAVRASNDAVDLEVRRVLGIGGSA